MSSKVNSGSSSSLSATNLKPFGRAFIDDKQNLQLISSAVHFGFTFEGTECLLFASITNKGGHNYLQYELDGQYQKRLKIAGNSTDPITITAPANGKHTVWIYKATEAHTGAILVQKITANKVHAIARPSAPLIEFIGNSITCGAAADPSEVACGKGEYHDQHNAYAAYGPGVARTLKTNFILSSVSGIGVYRNWNSNGPTMPQVYEKMDFQDNNTVQWNFAKYTPAIVSIALGTNDFSRGDGVKKRLPFDSAAFVTTYVKFIQLVKTKYPKAQIALLSSPMSGGNDRVLLQNCLTAVKATVDKLFSSDKQVAVFFFKPMQAHGCGGHPNVADHAILAAELTPFFKNLLEK
ncbi:MAG TPA: GDSL-type esterase/lipase family protein [Segetibacter sp.]